MKKKENQFQPHWKLNQYEFLNYFSSYISFFNDLEVKFCVQMKNEIVPLYLEIFGSEQNYNSAQLTNISETTCLLKQESDKFYNLIYDVSVIKDKEILQRKCKEFTVKFLQILKQYKLYDERYYESINLWLAHSVYSAARLNYAQLIIPPALIPATFSEELLDELWKDLSPQQWIEAELLRFEEIDANQSEIDYYVQNPFRPNVLPPAKSFQFVTYDIFLDMRQYEKMAMEAYRKHIKAYLQEIQNALKKHGWKRNKSEDYDRVHWLVLWNKFNFQYLWEIIQPIEEYCGVYVNVETVRKAFNKFKKLGLPVKPFGKGGKIITDKNNLNNSASKK